MFSQSADQPASDQPPAPIGMRELPPQPAKPMMPAYATTTIDQHDDEAGPGPDDSVIARDDFFEGTFTSRGTVRVLGSVKGRIEAVRVRIEDGAHVDADVIVDEAIIAGEFTGNLTCRNRLEARASGRISGRVETHKLMLHEGASVEGEMHMLDESAADATETIRGTASVRGETGAAETKPAAVKSSAARKDPIAPAPRTSASKSAASSASPPQQASAAPGSGPATSSGSQQAAPRQEVSSMSAQEAYAQAVRVTPRTTTPVGAASGSARSAVGSGSRNGSSTPSGF